MPIQHSFELANQRFYQFFARADFDAMSKLWAARLPVSCMHPGAVPLLNRADILNSWRQIFRLGHPGDITFLPQQMTLVGNVGVACGLELVAGAQVACTNLFAEEDGEWRMIHHQGGPVIPADLRRTAPTDGGNVTRH